MESKPQSRCRRPIREECVDGQVSYWRRRLIRQRSSIVTSAPAAVAAVAGIGPGAEESVLLTAARRGHPTAFGDLVEGHVQRLRHLAFRITRNREDAEDAVQDCFKSAFAHLESFRGQSQFSTWITRIAMNCALMKIRGRRRDIIPLDESIESCASVKYWRVLPQNLTPEENYSRKELDRILAKEIARLQPKLQSALHLHLREGLMAQEAAEVLGISSGALKARVHRARQALRLQFERHGVCKNPSMHSRRAGSSFSCHDRGSRRLFAPTGRNTGFGD